MSKRELITIAAAIVTSASALFGAMSYVEVRFVDQDELRSYISQVLNRLDSVDSRLQSIEEGLRRK
jgi:hypothetical protein